MSRALLGLMTIALAGTAQAAPSFSLDVDGNGAKEFLQVSVGKETVDITAKTLEGDVVLTKHLPRSAWGTADLERLRPVIAAHVVEADRLGLSTGGTSGIRSLTTGMPVGSTLSLDTNVASPRRGFAVGFWDERDNGWISGTTLVLRDGVNGLS